AYCWRELRQRDTANALLKLALSQDSMVVRAHKLLYINAVETGDSNQAHYHRDMIKQITPWYWPYLEADINRAISGSKAR
ncbi:MAG TPA: hypothetical protein VHP63_01230, partial [candidate division Zixibacteria bacterium]|nr:hypothetical protein [candidate division Zixibacteria bacterium]